MKLIKFSPKCGAAFQKLKAEIQPGLPGIQVLSPIHCTVRPDALKSLLQVFWEVCQDDVKDAETRAQTRIKGVAAQMSTFECCYRKLLDL